jgi:nucleoside-diphosphate-sugar epimerase
MKFLVTGGSGFLGINFIRYVLKEGHSVVSLDKEVFNYPEKNEKNKITAIVGDIRDKEIVNRCMEGVDIVVHTAAALPLYSKKEIFSTDVSGTKNILENAYIHKVKRVIHISSTAVYGIPDHHPLIETDVLVGVGPYGEAKILAEKVCLEYREKDMCVSIIRPKSFIGPERLGVFALFYDWAKDGKNFPMIGNGLNRYQLLDVEDLCEAIYLCATKDRKIVNDTFNIGAKEFTTMKGDYQAVLDKAGFGKKIIGLPAIPVIWALRILEALHMSPLYKWVYETAGKDSFVSIEKAEKVLGYKPRYSNKQALVRNYEWYLANVDNFAGKSGITHRVPWKQGILKIAKMFF